MYGLHDLDGLFPPAASKRSQTNTILEEEPAPSPNISTSSTKKPSTRTHRIRNPNRQNVINKDSPKVISSLISSLSAISTPVQQHFDKIPQTPAPDSQTFETPPSNKRAQTQSRRRSLVPSTGFGMDYGAFRAPAEEDDDALKDGSGDEAAAPPVVRMSTSSFRDSRRFSRSSGLSSKTAFEPYRPSSDNSRFSIGSWDRRNSSSSLGFLNRRSFFASDSSFREKQERSRGSFSLARSSTRETTDRDCSQLRKTRSDVGRQSLPGIDTVVLEVADESDQPAPFNPASPEPTKRFNRDTSSRKDSNSMRYEHGQSNRRSSLPRKPEIAPKQPLAQAHADPDPRYSGVERTTRRINELKIQKAKIMEDLMKSDEGELARTNPPTDLANTQPSQKDREQTLSNQGGTPWFSEGSEPAPFANELLSSRPSDVGTNSSASSPKLSPSRSYANVTTQDKRPASSDSIDDAIDAFLDDPRLTQKVKNPVNRRVIAFSEVGDPKGHAVFICVGMGLTRYLSAFYDELAWTLKLRLITPDRAGVGESDSTADGIMAPLSWPDDVMTICDHLKIKKFSLLAHSAGAIYALATALRQPSHVFGRIHLLAPWIPPSQLSTAGAKSEPNTSLSLPYSQRLLRILPTPIFKVANFGFLAMTSASVSPSSKQSRKNRHRRNNSESRNVINQMDATKQSMSVTEASKRRLKLGRTRGLSTPPLSPVNNHVPPLHVTGKPGASPDNATATTAPASPPLSSNSPVKPALPKPSAVPSSSTQTSNMGADDKFRLSEYDIRLTHAIWESATTDTNPTADLMVCFERRFPVGFRYADITRPVLIHHGDRDTRVPVDNVRWLTRMMRDCELRVLEGEGHGMMASARVMGNVFMEIAKEWTSPDSASMPPPTANSALTVTSNLKSTVKAW